MKYPNVFDSESQTEPPESWPISSFHELLLLAQIYAHSGGSLPPGWSLQTLDRLCLDGIDQTEGVCFTYASIDKRSWETLWLKTIVITKTLERDFRGFHQVCFSGDERGLICNIFTRSRSAALPSKPNSSVDTRKILNFGDVLSLLACNSSSSVRGETAPSSIMDYNLKTPEPYVPNQHNSHLPNYPYPATPVFPDAPNLDYLPPSLQPPPELPTHRQNESHDTDDIISIDETSQALIIDESSTHDVTNEVPPSPTESTQSSPSFPSPLADDHHDDNQQDEGYQREDNQVEEAQQVVVEDDFAFVPPGISPEPANLEIASELTNTKEKRTRRSIKECEKSFFCETCSKKFVWKKSFDQHMKVHLGVKEFSCYRCERCFPLKKQLVRHLKSSHKIESRHACHSCDKVFMLEADLETHIRCHAPKKVFKCPYVSEHEREGQPRCHKTFPSKSLLEIHVRVHTGEKPFKCHLCPKAYQQNQHLKEHLCSHSGELPFLCELCSKGFKSQAQLTLHLKMHAGEKKYVCQHEGCSKAYVTGSLLTKHVKTVHLGERPYLCPYCEKTYPKIYDLKNHIRSHTGERPFKCPDCGKDFAHKVVWKRHMNLHEVKNKKKAEKTRLEGSTEPSEENNQILQMACEENGELTVEVENSVGFTHVRHDVYETQWRRVELYASDHPNQRSEDVDVISDGTENVGDGNGPSLDQIHPKFRFIRKENVYSPSTVSVYSNGTTELSCRNDPPQTAGPAGATPRLPPAFDSSAPQTEFRFPQPFMQRPSFQASQDSHGPTSSTWSRPISPSNSQLSLPKLKSTPQPHILQLPTHTPYTHPFNYHLCPSFLPTFGGPAEDANNQINASAIAYPSFVNKSSHVSTL